MSEPKHTPGPWKPLCGSVVDTRGNIVGSRKSRVHLDRELGDIEPTEADLNCRLMAAAPTMKDAIQETATELNVQRADIMRELEKLPKVGETLYAEAARRAVTRMRMTLEGTESLLREAEERLRASVPVEVR